MSGFNVKQAGDKLHWLDNINWFNKVDVWHFLDTITHVVNHLLKN